METESRTESSQTGYQLCFPFYSFWKQKGRYRCRPGKKNRINPLEKSRGHLFLPLLLLKQTYLLLGILSTRTRCVVEAVDKRSHVVSIGGEQWNSPYPQKQNHNHDLPYVDLEVTIALRNQQIVDQQLFTMVTCDPKEIVAKIQKLRVAVVTKIDSIDPI